MTAPDVNFLFEGVIVSIATQFVCFGTKGAGSTLLWMTNGNLGWNCFENLRDHFVPALGVVMVSVANLSTSIDPLCYVPWICRCWV